MAYDLNPTQRRTASIFLGLTRRPIIRKALIEAGLVEANLLNPRYGDRDSIGSLQERSHYGSVGRRLNRRAAGRRFVREANAVLGGGFQGSAGELAQRVQRSAYPGRYDQRSAAAESIIRTLGGGRGGGASNAPTSSGRGGAGGLPVPEPGGEGVAALLASMQAQRPSFAGTPPQAPFSARRYLSLPKGYPGIETSGPPQRGASISDLIAASTALGKDGLPMPESVPNFYAGNNDRPPDRPRRGVGSWEGGSVKIAPGADRPGVRTGKGILRFARKVSSQFGGPLTVGTGTHHSQFTVDGNVSQHWSGDAVDIPARGKRLIRMGQAALIAAGMPERRARTIRGGLFNVGGRQIIFNTNKGGDHYDHLHLGA